MYYSSDSEEEEEEEEEEKPHIIGAPKAESDEVCSMVWSLYTTT